MICFDVYVNNEKVCRAGLKDALVLGCTLNWAKSGDREDLFLQVGGLYEDSGGRNAHPSWIEQLNIKRGYEITIKVIEADSPDEPVTERVYEAEDQEKRERKYFEHLKAKFEPGG